MIWLCFTAAPVAFGSFSSVEGGAAAGWWEGSRVTRIGDRGMRSATGAELRDAAAFRRSGFTWCRLRC